MAATIMDTLATIADKDAARPDTDLILGLLFKGVIADGSGPNLA